MSMGKKDLKILVSANHNGLILIYDKKREKYDVWHNGKNIDKIIGKAPKMMLEKQLILPKNQFLENIKNNKYPEFIKSLHKTIEGLGIETEKQFLLKDLIIELNSDEKIQRNNFDALNHELKLKYFLEEDLKENPEDNLSSIYHEIIISKEINGFYLAYNNFLQEYTLFKCNGDDVEQTKLDDCSNPKILSAILDDVIDENPNYEFQDLPNDALKELLHGLENKKDLLYKLLDDLYEVFYQKFEQNNDSYREDRINSISNVRVYETLTAETKEIINNDAEVKNGIIMILKDAIEGHFEDRENKEVEMGRRKLSQLLNMKYGLILRKYIGTLYKVNENGYEPTSHDDLIIELSKLFGDNFIHESDLKKAIGYISQRLEPIPNIIKFENTLFDMEKIDVYNSTKPIFTVLNIPYKYNPNAKSTIFKNFLNTSFKRETAEETAEAVKGIKQLCGYFFTSGNSLEILPIFTGLTGAGKSTLLNILTGIFGKDKISGISLQSLENDVHASSGFIGKHLNIIRDSDTSIIKNNSILKTWTGNESYPVNPKFKDLFDLPADEVPKPILACNTMPVFKVYDDAVIRRFVIVEFLVSMTKKGKAIKDLDKKILAEAEEVEWFIYESIQAYKEMVENGETFVFKISDEETKELIEKHTHPINHIVRMLILKHDPKAYDDEKAADFKNEFRPIFTDDLVDAILFVSDRDGIDVPVKKHGKIDQRKLLNVIRDEYDLHDGEIVKNKNTGKYDNHREYNTRQERFDGLNKKCYPNLIATAEYSEIINQILKERTGGTKDNKQE